MDEELAWEMTPQEEEAQQRGNAEALVNFIGRMGGAARAKASDEAPEEGEHEEDEDTDAPDRPLTEDEADKMLDESDRLADRINARVEKEGGEQLDRIIEEELERRRVERGERLQTPEEEARRAEWVDEMNRAAEEVLANPAPDHEAVMKRAHPLAERARELSFALRKETKKRRWIPPDAMHDHEHPVADLIGSILSASAKFAGALNGEEWPPAIDFCAMKIARLKRARSYLDHALLAAEFCSQREIVDADWIARTQREINALGRECDVLIGELRARLAGPAG
ncbi:MAG TPA: hypothetical protein VM029_17495 [Opitutaceae bacterium]|nr:hypothetical protein [Opitutaceae bacterium]